MKCPNGFLFGYDYGSRMECSECGDELYDCASRWKTCIKKVTHTNETSANIAARESTINGRKYGSYRCPYCNEWHVGRQWD